MRSTRTIRNPNIESICYGIERNPSNNRCCGPTGKPIEGTRFTCYLRCKKDFCASCFEVHHECEEEMEEIPNRNGNGHDRDNCVLAPDLSTKYQQQRQKQGT